MNIPSARCIGRPGLALLCAMTLGCGALRGQAFLDPGFESYVVSGGGFVIGPAGDWLFANDAGVVEPYSAPSSGGALNTWSATLPAVEGQQYASTYAAADSLRQQVVFPAAGAYRIHVWAASPSGSVTIPRVGTFTLGHGEFTFLLNNVPIGDVHTVTAGESWGHFTADFTINAAGPQQLGVRNTRTAPYFINYDSFALEPIPEPAVIYLSLGLGVATVLRCVRRR